MYFLFLVYIVLLGRLCLNFIDGETEAQGMFITSSISIAVGGEPQFDLLFQICVSDLKRIPS